MCRAVITFIMNYSMYYIQRFINSLPIALCIFLTSFLIICNNISNIHIRKMVQPKLHFENFNSASMKYGTYYLNELNDEQTTSYSHNNTEYMTMLYGRNLNKLNNYENISSTFNESILTAETLNVLKNLIKCEKISFKSEIIKKRDFVVYTNYVRADHGEFECYEDVTLATHGEFTFLDNLEVLIQRWSAPMSVALYVPGTDLLLALSSIKYLRECSSQKYEIKNWVTFHIYFQEMYSPVGINNDPLANISIDCSVPAPYLVSSNETFKYRNNLEYPVNVGRNVAREGSLTHYVLSLDIEMYPSPNLGRKFLNLIARNNFLITGSQPRVFAIKPFEIRKDSKVPTDKNDIIRMLHNRTAIIFHMKVCPRCHISPLTKEWIEQGETKYMEITGIGKRLYKFANWEAIFIGTKKDPNFDERLTWEGKGDKMAQSFTLCLLDYDFLILSNAFVVHHPGIKIFQHETPHRLSRVKKQNTLIANVIVTEYYKRYGSRKGCRF